METKEKLKEQLALLKEKRKEYEIKAENCDVLQIALKLVLNSAYGAFGSVYYPLYDIDIAESTTIGGKTATLEMVKYVNQYMNKLQGTENEEFIVAGDTDSGLFNVYINDKLEYIEDVFNKNKTNDNILVLENGTEVLYPTQNLMTKSLYGNTKIKNISRHKVTKDKWLISINGLNTLFTKDHSIMIYRDGYVMKCKPEDIKETDYLIEYIKNNKIKYKQKNFTNNNNDKIKISIEELQKNEFKLTSVKSKNVEIKHLGQFKNEYVYDIEVEDGSHTFIAENLLAHNSCVNTAEINGTGKQIENLFNEYSKKCIPTLLYNNKDLKKCTEIIDLSKNKFNEYTYSINGKTKIKNITRHKVSKEKYKITIDNNILEITGDHSIMVYRDGKIIECKPSEIKNTDYLLMKK